MCICKGGTHIGICSTNPPGQAPSFDFIHWGRHFEISGSPPRSCAFAQNTTFYFTWAGSQILALKLKSCAHLQDFKPIVAFY